MKINLKVFFIVLTTLLSCKSDNLEEVLKNSQTQRLDLAYYTVVKSEMAELGNSIGIVDKTTDTTSTKLTDIIPNYSKSEKSIYWKKEIFPRMDYLSGDSIESYRNGRTNKYWELRESYEYGWIELTTPYFTNEQKMVLLEVRFYQGSSFGYSTYYLLEWTGKEYIIKEKGLISIS